MKVARAVVLAAFLLVCRTTLWAAQDSKPVAARDHPRSEWVNEKATKEAIEKIQKKLHNLEKDFAKDKAELGDRIAQEKNGEKRNSLAEKLAELESKFQGGKARFNKILSSLEILPIERPTLDTESHLLVGNCGNLLALSPMDPRREVIESLKQPPSMCSEYQSRSIGIYINDAGPLLQSSACFTPSMAGSASGTYSFRAPGLVFMTFCNVKGGDCLVFVFMERMPALENLVRDGSLRGRDVVLTDICPPQIGQIQVPEIGNWTLLPFAANKGNEDYDMVISGIVGGTLGSLMRPNMGLSGLEAISKATRVNSFEVRNVVLDSKFIPLVSEVQKIWTELDKQTGEYFSPMLLRRSAIKELEDGAMRVLEGKEDVSAVSVLEELTGKAEKFSASFGKEFSSYHRSLSEIRDLFLKKDEKGARKKLEALIKKQLRKEREKIDKELSPVFDPRQRAIDFLQRMEFVAAGDAMADMAKKHPDIDRRQEFKELVERYRPIAREARDYLEKIKSRAARQLNRGELLEPITIKSKDSAVIMFSVTGGEYDFETQKPRFKLVLEDSFIPASEEGIVEKNAKEITGVLAGYFDVDELLANGFDKAVLNTKGKDVIIAAVRGPFGELPLLAFADASGVVREEVPLASLKDENKLRWIAAMQPYDSEAKIVPRDPGRFLSTFNFLDKDGNSLTMLNFIFESKHNVVLQTKDGKTINLTFLRYPGIWRSRLTIVDVLQTDPEKRILELPLLQFRVLAPED